MCDHIKYCATCNAKVDRIVIAIHAVLDCYYDEEDGISLIPYIGESDSEIKRRWMRLVELTAKNR